MVGIDRNRVQHAFTSHAGEYDTHAVVQKCVVDRFVSLLGTLPASPENILDIGAGTGALLQRLTRLYPVARLVGVDLAPGMCQAARANLAGLTDPLLLTADAEVLPFAGESFDLIVSTSTFQWLESLDAAFAEALRVLRPGGWFAFALFGERTLHELRDSYRSAWERAGRGPEERTHSFHDVSEVETVLQGGGFRDARVTSELETERHPDVPALLRSIRRIGAGNAAPVRSRGLAERRVMLDMIDIYRREYAVDGLIPATYEVVYGVGRRG